MERIAGWSARHRKTAVFGWLLLVAVVFVAEHALGILLPAALALLGDRTRSARKWLSRPRERRKPGIPTKRTIMKDPHVSRPNCADIYYLGRPASLWTNVMKPPRRRTAAGLLA